MSAFSGEGMSGSGRRRTSKWDSEEVSHHFPGEPIGPGHGRPGNSEPQATWHSGERSYKEARESLDATMVWDGESMSPGLDDWRQQKRKYSYESSRARSYRSRSRSKSPGHRFERADLNDRRGRVTSFDHRNRDPHRSSNIPCKFFASGNCRNGKFCRFSHNDHTHDSFNNYEADDHRQGMDSRLNVAPLREDSKWSGSVSELNVATHYGNKNEGRGEPMGMRSYVDESVATDDRFMAHRMDSDEAARNNKSGDFRLTAHTSSGMGVFESRGTAIRGVDMEGSTNTGILLPTLARTSGKPDVLDTVRSEAAASNQCLMSTEQFSELTLSLARLLEEGKQLPELYAALNASNALGFMQSSASGSAGPDVVPASSSSQYDPVNDSMELIKSVISEQPDEIALPSQLPLTGEPSGGGMYRTHCKEVDLNLNSNQSSEKHEFADCKSDEHGIVKAEEMKEGKDGSKLANSEDERKKNNDGKSLRAFKFALAEFVKELLKPSWKAGKINKEAHNTIVKKVVNKVTSSVQGLHIPQTQEKIDNYLSASKPKLSKLVQAYVEKVQKENPKAA